MENPIKMDVLGGKKPYFWRATHIAKSWVAGINIALSGCHLYGLLRVCCPRFSRGMFKGRQENVAGALNLAH